MNNAASPGSRLMIFSKPAAIGILVLIAILAIIILGYIYFQGGLSHAVHQ